VKKLNMQFLHDKCNLRKLLDGYISSESSYRMRALHIANYIIERRLQYPNSKELDKLVSVAGDESLNSFEDVSLNHRGGDFCFPYRNGFAHDNKYYPSAIFTKGKGGKDSELIAHIDSDGTVVSSLHLMVGMVLVRIWEANSEVDAVSIYRLMKPGDCLVIRPNQRHKVWQCTNYTVKLACMVKPTAHNRALLTYYGGKFFARRCAKHVRIACCR